MLCVKGALVGDTVHGGELVKLDIAMAIGARDRIKADFTIRQFA